ncbi:MAG: GNAT family N-acetyltransferase [Candidatus Shapirobacteria bacterium]
MTIETLKKSEIESYKKLIDEVFDGSNELSDYQKFDPEANYQIVVARDGEKIVGSVTFYKIDLFTFSFQPALEIFNVAVLKEYRQQKIAQQLFQYIIDYAKKNGYKSIFLTCLDSAIPAHKLYESMGFVKANSVKYNLFLN